MKKNDMRLSLIVVSISLLFCFLFIKRQDKAITTIEGTVVEIRESTVYVESTNTLYTLSKEEYHPNNLKVNDNVIIKCDGIVFETNPARFNKIYSVKKRT